MQIIDDASRRPLILRLRQKLQDVSTQGRIALSVAEQVDAQAVLQQLEQELARSANSRQLVKAEQLGMSASRHQCQTLAACKDKLQAGHAHNMHRALG